MNFFRLNDKTSEIVEEITLPGTKLTYDRTLIGKLKKDHRKILKMHSVCITAYDKKRYTKLNKALRQLKIKYTAHLLLENTRFYTYIKHYFKTDKRNTSLIKRFSKDMDKNGKLVFQFLDKSTQSNYEYDDSFHQELEIVGSLLRERFVAGERELYFLYQPPEP